MTMRSLLLLPLATTLSLLAACVSESERLDYPTLVGRFAEEAETPPLIADEAWLSKTDFYVRFWRGDNVRYGGGNWAGRIPILGLDEGGRYDGPFLLPLQYERGERWAELPADRKPVRLLDIPDWHALRARLFATLLSRDERAGVVLHLNIDDYCDDFTKFEKLGDVITAVMRYQLERAAERLERLADTAETREPPGGTAAAPPDGADAEAPDEDDRIEPA
jgi:hypothetical protein